MSMEGVCKSEIMLLIGAGASRPMGIPTMREFTGAFEDETEKYEEEKAIIQKMRVKINKNNKKKWDIENLLRSIKDMLSIEENMAFHLLNLGNSNEYSEFAKLHRPTYEKIYEKLLAFIRQKCTRYDKDRAKNLYKKLLSLSEIAKLHVFTTNYDCIIEDFCVFGNLEFNDGFVPHPKGSFIWESKTLGTSDTINLYKLHGSTSWYSDKENNEIFKEPRHLEETKKITNIMIYPGGTKEALQSPYLELHSHFVKILHNVQRCAVIGSSLRDNYLRDLLRARVIQEDFNLDLISPDAGDMRWIIFGPLGRVTLHETTFEKWVESDLEDFKAKIEDENRKQKRTYWKEQREKAIAASNSKIIEKRSNFKSKDSAQEIIEEDDFDIVRGQCFRVLDKIFSSYFISSADKRYLDFVMSCIQSRKLRDEKIELIEDFILHIFDGRLGFSVLKYDSFLTQILEFDEFKQICREKGYIEDFLEGLVKSTDSEKAAALARVMVHLADLLSPNHIEKLSQAIQENDCFRKSENTRKFLVQLYEKLGKEVPLALSSESQKEEDGSSSEVPTTC